LLARIEYPVLNRAHDRDHVFVFPESHDRPPALLQLARCLGVSASIALDLGGPELGVRLSDGVMLRAAMPEAPVDEDREPQSGKHDVGGPSYVA
jgi:hypothetical protein